LLKIIMSIDGKSRKNFIISNIGLPSFSVRLIWTTYPTNIKRKIRWKRRMIAKRGLVNR
jgi:hypothetical protein